MVLRERERERATLEHGRGSGIKVTGRGRDEWRFYRKGRRGQVCKMASSRYGSKKHNGHYSILSLPITTSYPLLKYRSSLRMYLGLGKGLHSMDDKVITTLSRVRKSMSVSGRLPWRRGLAVPLGWAPVRLLKAEIRLEPGTR